MKMKLYLLLYNRAGVPNLGDARGIKVRNCLSEFVLVGGGGGVLEAIDVGGDGEAKRLGTPCSRVKQKIIVLCNTVTVLYR
jgi:hypothetical protein